MSEASENLATPREKCLAYQPGVFIQRIPLDDANTVDKGLAVDIIAFDNVAPTFDERSSNAVDSTIFSQEDSKLYTRVCYETAAVMPLGFEYTVPAPVTGPGGTRYNDLVGGCSGGCDGARWFLGIDPGFAALAGVQFAPSQDCSPNMLSVKPKDMISEVLNKHCGSRCAQSLYNMTAATAARTEAPGYRTLVSQIANWSAWVGCSIYNSFIEWAANDGPAYAFADTLRTSKIHFVDAELSFVGRPHSPGILHKRPGWESHGTERWIATCEKYGMRGVYQQQNISLGLVPWVVALYGRSKLAWSIMALDSLFYADYNLFSDNSPCLGWWDHVRRYARNAIAVPDSYIGCYAAGSALTFGMMQVKQRLEQEAAARSLAVRRGGTVWEDKRLWSSYMMSDIGGTQLAILTGGCADDMVNLAMGRVINDIIDLGYDWASGDFGNSILTLTDGKTGRDDLAKAYVKAASVLNRMGTLRPDTAAGIYNLLTYAWQMCDTRHRVHACVMTSNDPGIGPTNLSASWHQAVILNESGSYIEHEMVIGQLNGRTVELTARSWRAILKNPIAGTLLYYGHCWLVEKRYEKEVASAEEILEIEDILRCALIEASMELDRKDYTEALWCWMIEGFCATDLMWHAMIGSTTVSADRRIGSDRWDDANRMQEWGEH